MIRRSGTVLRVEGDLAWVECERGGTCAICPGRGACETALFLSHTRSSHRLRARTGARRLEPGADVVVGVPDGALLRAAVFAYALPLAALIGGAALGSIAGSVASGAGAALGLAAGITLAGRVGRGRPASVPLILEQIDS
jgi:sigma-E factor negative regulatory protein RseC